MSEVSKMSKSSVYCLHLEFSYFNFFWSVNFFLSVKQLITISIMYEVIKYEAIEFKRKEQRKRPSVHVTTYEQRYITMTSSLLGLMSTLLTISYRLSSASLGTHSIPMKGLVSHKVRPEKVYYMCTCMAINIVQYPHPLKTAPAKWPPDRMRIIQTWGLPNLYRIW